MEWTGWMQIIANLIGTISLMCVICFVVINIPQNSWLNKKNVKIRKAVFIGIIAGVFGVYATISSTKLSSGALVSVRDIGPMFAGVIGGPIAGLVAGFIAGLQRLLFFDWSSQTVLDGTSIPCALSTLLLGVICGFLYQPFSKAKYKPLWAMLIGAVGEIMHLSIAFVYLIFRNGVEDAWKVISGIAIPFLATNSLGFSLLTLTLQSVRKYKKIETHEKQISTELNVATKIQKDMLPIILPTFPGQKEFEMNGIMVPAKEVGGDFYDIFFYDDDHIYFLIADVSGKGIPAALFMVISKTILKNNALSCLSPKEVLEKSNAQLFEGNQECMFVTVWLGLYEISSGKLTYANGGHNPPLIKQFDDKFRYLKNLSGPFLAATPKAKYKEYETYLYDGDCLVIYTDGVTEAMNEKKELYGEERLKKLVEKYCNNHRQIDVVYEVEKEIAKYRKSEDQSDDITLLALSVNGKHSKITVDSNIENFAILSDFINNELRNKRVPEEEINKLIIVLDELFSNVVYYSKAPTFTLGISSYSNRISMVMEYKGQLFDITKQDEPDTKIPLEDRPIGGLGIMIVKKTVDSISYHVKNNDTNAIRIIKTY